jgi:hypothetical protein
LIGWLKRGGNYGVCCGFGNGRKLEASDFTTKLISRGDLSIIPYVEWRMWP